MTDFLAAIQQAGLGKPTIIDDGQIHRFACQCSPRRENAWYIYFPGEYPGGAFGCYKCGVWQKWSAGKTDTLSDSDRRQYQQRIENEKQKREQERKQKQQAAAEKARWIWQHSQPVESHPYLEKKQVQSYDLRVYKGSLVIPLYGPSGIQSLQFINKAGEKRYLKGGKITGGYFPIGELTDTLYLCEGYATAATVYEITAHAVAVAFNCKNLLHVAKRLRRKHPDAEIIIAGDNDWQTEQKRGKNPGVEAAIKAAQAISGEYCIPEFEEIT